MSNEQNTFNELAIVGPQGCGKTTNAERFRQFFGLDHIIDDWTLNDDRRIRPKTLVISTDSRALMFFPNSLHFDAAISVVENAAAPASNPPAGESGPAHYLHSGLQPWDAMAHWMTREQFIGFLRGNAIKYLARAGHKGDAETMRRDYEKARHYLAKLAEVLDEEHGR